MTMQNELGAGPRGAGAPRRAAEGGMKMKPQINRMRTKGSEIMEGHYEEILRARQDGKLVAWGFGNPATEILEAMGIVEMHTGNHSARLAAAQVSHLLIEEAMGEGFSADLCSYAKINIGVALYLVRGKMGQLPERLQVPRPDFLFATSHCPIYTMWVEVIRRILDVPVFVIDVPYTYNDDKRWEQNLAFMEGQLRDLVAFLERLTGRPYDWAALKEIQQRLREMSQIRREIQELSRQVPAVRSIFDAIGSFGPSNTASIRCRPEAMEFFKRFKAELEQRVASGAAVLPEGEEVRLGWRGVFPWFIMGHLSRLTAQEKAVIVGSAQYGGRQYGWTGRERLPPDGIDPGQPLKTCAVQLLTNLFHPLTFQQRWQTEVVEWNEGFKLDGIVFHAPRTCRPWSYWSYDLADKAEKELGIPAIVIEADHADPQFYSEAQVDVRLQAFIETIKSRKRARERGKGPAPEQAPEKRQLEL